MERLESKAGMILQKKADAMKLFLDEALEDFQKGELQEALEVFIVVSALAREMVGAVNRERYRQAEGISLANICQMPIPISSSKPSSPVDISNSGTIRKPPLSNLSIL